MKLAFVTLGLILPALAFVAAACGSEEFETKAASNDDSGTGGSSSGGTGGGGGSGGSAGSITDGGKTDGSVISCDLDAGALNTEGCACSLQGDVKGCYLGMPGPQSACTQGNQMCNDGKWGSCVGALGPSDEKCDDALDNDCDGTVDEGCFCTPTTNLCKDSGGNTLPSGDNAFVDKDVVLLGDTLHIYVVSTLPIPNIAHSVSSPSTTFYCSGQGGVSTCAVGNGCDGWNGAVIAMEVSSPPFHPGEPAEITVYIDDPTPPCDGTRTRKVSVDVQ